MGTTTSNMGLSKPTLAGDAGTWDDQLNASLDLLDAHDHSTGKGVKITAAGLNLTTDVTLNGTAALTNTKAMAFTTQASYTTIRSLWVKTSDGELYWRNGSGTDVKMTSGGTLNMSIVGGIVGDYAAASAAVYYDDANQAYRFLEAAPLPNSWSRVQCGDLDLYEHASGIANRVRISSPTALAASYALTLPAALPASTSLLQVSSAGAVTASNTVANAVTFSALSTHSNGITVTTGSANLNGAASIKLPARVLNLDLACGIQSAGTATYDGSKVGFAAVTQWDLPLLLHEGDRVNGIKFYYARNSGGNISVELFSRDMAGTNTQLAIKTISAGTGNANSDFTSPTAGSLPQTLAANKTYMIRLSAGNTDVMYGVYVTYDRP